MFRPMKLLALGRVAPRGAAAPRRRSAGRRHRAGLVPGDMTVIPLSFHQPLLGLSGAHWLDGPPDLSCKDSTRQYLVDGCQLSCKPLPACSDPTACQRFASNRAAYRLAAPHFSILDTASQPVVL